MERPKLLVGGIQYARNKLERLEGHVASAWRGETALLVPESVLAEVVRVLWKKEGAGSLNSSEVDQMLFYILDLPIEIVGHDDLLPDAVLIARSHNLTIYDALFLALAGKKGAQSITADQKLENSNVAGVVTGSKKMR